MSVHVLSWVLKRSPVDDPASRLVLIVIADHADEQGENSFPKRETIAHEARIPERTVGDRLRALRQAGHIEEMGRTGYQNRVVVWRVVMDDERRAAIRQAVPDSNERQSGSSAPDQSGSRLPDSRVEASKEPPEPSLDGSLARGWERVRAGLRERGVSEFIDHVWLAPIVPLDARPGLLRLGASPSHYGWVRERYLDGIAEVAAEISGRAVSVELVPLNASHTTSGATRTVESAPAATGRPATGAESSLEAPPPERGDP